MVQKFESEPFAAINRVFFFSSFTCMGSVRYFDLLLKRDHTGKKFPNLIKSLQDFT